MPLQQDIIDRTFHTKQGEQAYKVCETLFDAGFEAWWVGGCIRDMFLGQVPLDIDIATNALPTDICILFPKCDESAAAMGSILVSSLGEVLEVTTFREDSEVTNGRHPSSVQFTTKEKDATRRDITINALYWNPITSELWAPFEGEKDLNEKLIRIIGNPTKRLQQDALRLLRVIRFRALIQGQYHPDTFAALHKNAKNIEVLSGLRRFTELEKILVGPNPEIALEDLWETDILEYIVPELHACKGVAQPSKWHGTKDVWEHTLVAVSKYTADHLVDVRLATLFHDIGKPSTFTIEDDRIHFNDHARVGAEITKTVLQRLHAPKKRIEKICWLVAHHMMMGTFEELSIERKGHWYYHPWFVELLQVFWLDAAGCVNPNFELYDAIIQDYNTYLDEHPLPPKPLLNGSEVMDILGIQPGEQVGKIMKELYNAQIGGKILNKKSAEEFVQNYNS